MSIDGKHLLIAFLAVLIALLVLILVGPTSVEKSDAAKALIAMTLTLGGAVAGNQMPKG